MKLPACLFAICYVLALYTDHVRQAIDKSLLTFSEAQPFARSILHCVEQVFTHKVLALTATTTPEEVLLERKPQQSLRTKNRPDLELPLCCPLASSKKQQSERMKAKKKGKCRVPEEIRRNSPVHSSTNRKSFQSSAQRQSTTPANQSSSYIYM